VYKIAFIGDLHFGIKNFKDMNKALNLAIDVCISEEVDCVIQLGDVFDHYNISTGQTSVATVVEAVKVPLSRLCESNCRVLIIEGNHDKPPIAHQDEYYRSSIELLRRDGVDVFTTPVILQLEGIDTLVIPWCGEADRPKLRLVQNEFINLKSKFRLAVGHLLMEGSVAPNGMQLEGGDFFFSNKEIESLKLDLFVAGHIHRRQLAYPGIIMHHSLNDVDAPTGIRIVTIDDYKIVEDKFVELRTPKYHLIELESSLTSGITEAIKQCNDVDHYVIRIFDKPQASIKLPSNVRLEYRPPTEITSRLSLKKEEAFKMTKLEAWELWARRNNIAENIIQLAINIMKDNGIV
jgi:DNA repair exonuclease SbcCD nuclease subunit